MVVITDELSLSILYDLVIENQHYAVASSGHSNDQWALEFSVYGSDTSTTPPIDGEPQFSSGEMR